MDKYSLIVHKDFGCALCKYNPETMLWQKVSKWYARFENLYRYVMKPLGIPRNIITLFDASRCSSFLD